MALNSYLSIISLNGNRLNAPIKTHMVSYWIKKQETSIHCLQEPHFRPRHLETESEGVENHLHTNGPEKKAGVAIVTSDKLNFKP